MRNIMKPWKLKIGLLLASGVLIVSLYWIIPLMGYQSIYRGPLTILILALVLFLIQMSIRTDTRTENSWKVVKGKYMREAQELRKWWEIQPLNEFF